MHLSNGKTISALSVNDFKGIGKCCVFGMIMLLLQICD